MLLLSFIAGVLWFGCFLFWLPYIADGKVHHTDFLPCQIVYYFLNIGFHASVWVLVSMTGEKCAAIIFPFQAKRFSTIKVARITCGVIIALWALFHIQWFFIIEKVEANGEVWCDYSKDITSKYFDFYDVFDHVAYSLLPCMLIFILNIAIIVRLILARTSSAESVKTSSLSKTAVSTTIMLLSVSVTFTLLTMPSAVHYFYTLHRDAIYEFRIVTVFFYYTNHSCNAIMYFLLSPRFRQEVGKFVCKLGDDLQDTSLNESQNTLSSMRHRNKVGPSEVSAQ